MFIIWGYENLSKISGKSERVTWPLPENWHGLALLQKLDRSLSQVSFLHLRSEEKLKIIHALTLILGKRKWIVIKITHAWQKCWMVITRWAHILLACAIHHLKALIEEIEVWKYPHCLFFNYPQRDFWGFPHFLPFVSHNFSTRNARKPIKPSKDSFCDVNKEKFLMSPRKKQILWCHQEKSNNLKLSNFSFYIETRRLSASVECLNSSPA